MQSPSPTTEAEVELGTDAQSPSLLADLSWQEIASRARLEADGVADQHVVTALSTDPLRWRNVLIDMIESAEDRLQSVRRLKGPQRNQVIIDFEGELGLLTDAYQRATGKAYQVDNQQDQNGSCLLYTSPSPRD